MDSKKFIKIFACCVFIVFILIVGLNYLISPFGLFGDRYFDWYSFNMTQNPRIAKIEYLKKIDKNIDSFIVGASGASAFPTKDLKRYTGHDYYNTFSYGSDMLDSVNTVKWLVKNYDVKNILLPLEYTAAAHYDVGNDTMNNAMHEELDDTNKLKFYIKYLFANPNYSFDKLKYMNKQKFLQESYNVFDVKDGSYDKRKRDIEPIGNMEEYLSREEYKEFKFGVTNKIHLDCMNEFISSMEEIVKICNDKDINLKVLIVPVAFEDFGNYYMDELEEFYRRLAKVTDYYDFAKTSISCDSRFFYDRTHFRNDVGSMILSYIYDTDDVYVPDDFGNYIQNGDATEVLKRINAEVAFNSNGEKKVPVFIYHNFSDKGNNSMTISYENFKNQMQAIKDSGYQTLTLEEIRDYVYYGKEIPDKSVLITIDDGYKSNLGEPYKILKNFGFRATIFPIGSSVGKDTYKDTDKKIFPHFSIEDAKKTMDVFSFGSHTYDMHQSTKLETCDVVRNFAVPLEKENELIFANVFREDMAKEEAELREIMSDVKTFAYPGGMYSEVTAALLNEKDYQVTFLTTPNVNYLVKGLKQSLLGLGRLNMTDGVSYEDTKRLLAKE